MNAIKIRIQFSYENVRKVGVDVTWNGDGKRLSLAYCKSIYWNSVQMLRIDICQNLKLEEVQ